VDWAKELVPEETPLIILAEGCFGESASKLALGVLRYGSWPVVAVIDASKAGQSVRQVTGLDCDAPVVATFQQALHLCEADTNVLKPKALLLGTAPPGGQLPAEWLPVLREAVAAKLHLINGLHFFLNENEALVSFAKQAGVRLWDVRDPEGYGVGKFKTIAHRMPRPAQARIITLVGTDCSVGKMHTALELYHSARASGASAAFVATGQTGILIAGRGVPLDRVIGDFMAGAMESCIQEEIRRLEMARPGEMHWIFVEGQGSLLHPAYSGVTLALLHGSHPDALILCHKTGMTTIRHYPDIPIPSLSKVIQAYEEAAAWSRDQLLPKARVLGLALNTSASGEAEALKEIEQISQDTGLSVVDPVRQGAQALWEALQAHDFSADSFVEETKAGGKA
jgi:uncharacterized NAD-dependent epimerase/dehydratase family protein